MMTKQTRRSWLAAALACGVSVSAAVAGLDGPATIHYDTYRVPTIVAGTEHDAIYLQGYLHAKNRFFQMEFQRRLFSGRVSELVGSSGLAQDIQLRTLGLKRAAERSLLVQSPDSMAWLQAYAEGVNAWLQSAEPLPIEFSALEITKAGIDPWTPLDSLIMAKGLAFGLSFDLGDTNRTLALLNYRGVCGVVGCNGLQLYNDDLWRVAPFESAVSIPSPPLVTENVPSTPPGEELPGYMLDPSFQEMVVNYRDQIAEIPILSSALNRDSGEVGSNWWVVSGANTESGYPMLASDPHLSLGTPATFYEVHLNVTGGINVTGVSFPGTPGVVIGCNDTICWGATVNSQDVTDVFNETLVPVPGQPTTPFAILFEGVPEPLTFIPQTFFINVLGDGVLNTKVNANIPATSGGLTMVVPRRNNGPIVQVTFNATTQVLSGLSVQYTGWSATHEVETLRRFARAASMADFKDALQYFDVGSQNWSYADVNGNIAYYTSGELPLRQDLQTLMFPAGLLHPGIIRDGTNTNKHQWLPQAGPPQPNQTLSTAILPFAEMPQVENPPEGYILNANNDPIGTTLDNVSWNQFRQPFPNGLLYLSAGYASGERLGQIQRQFADVLAGAGTMSLSESIAIQGNNQLLDAEILSPHLLQAYTNAIAPGAPPELAALAADVRIGEAIARIASWDFSSPTGIPQGFDPFDTPFPGLPVPSPAEVNASVATTIYSVWRGQMVQRVIDQTLSTLPGLSSFAPGSDQAMSALRRFLDNYDVNGGVGSSLINFFRVPGVADPFVARDIILLQTLQNGLNLLASPTFAPAFAGSTIQDDYRWGKLHRIVFSHFLGGPFNMPPPGHPLNVSSTLPGIARAGGRQAVDASAHDARADGLNEFMFSSGPARRIQAVMSPGCPQILEVIPGGENGAPGHPNATDQLFLWLVNAYKELPVCLTEVLENAVESQQLFCGNGVRDPGEACDDGNLVESDGCTSACVVVPAITCLSPSVSAGADVCSAEVACAAVATCSDAAGATTTSCDPEGPYGLGSTNVTVECDGPSGSSTATCGVTVTDDTPPTITVSTTPEFLWPPNHRMSSVDVTVSVFDACDAEPAIVLVSATSSELDDDPAPGDGHTINDIQGADVGTADLQVLLRAERNGLGSGRSYTLTYQALDDSGNSASAAAVVDVPIALSNVVEPINISLDGAQTTRVTWGTVPGATRYDIIRGDLSALRILGSNVDLGMVSCIEAHSLDTSTADLASGIPAPGQVFFYAVQFHDGHEDSTYGSVTVGRARVVAGGNCE